MYMVQQLKSESIVKKGKINNICAENSKTDHINTVLWYSLPKYAIEKTKARQKKYTV